MLLLSMLTYAVAVKRLPFSAGLSVHVTPAIGGGKGGGMGLKPHLILRVLHRILIFYHRNIFFPVK